MQLNLLLPCYRELGNKFNYYYNNNDYLYCFYYVIDNIFIIMCMLRSLICIVDC